MEDQPSGGNPYDYSSPLDPTDPDPGVSIDPNEGLKIVPAHEQ